MNWARYYIFINIILIDTLVLNFIKLEEISEFHKYSLINVFR